MYLIEIINKIGREGSGMTIAIIKFKVKVLGNFPKILGNFPSHGLVAVKAQKIL